ATVGATCGPGRQAAPGVRPGLKRYDGREVGLWRAVLEVLVKKRPQDLPAEVQPRIAAEFQSAERAAVTDLLAVMPRTHHQKYLVVRGVFRLDRLVDGDVAVDILLVPEAVHQHNGHLHRLGRQNAIHGLVTPEGIVAGVR